MYTIEGEVLPGLAKVMEETAELNVILAKLIGMGGNWKYFDGTDLRAEAINEISDVVSSLYFFVKENFNEIEQEQMETRTENKVDLYNMWRNDPK